MHASESEAVESLVTTGSVPINKPEHWVLRLASCDGATSPRADARNTMQRVQRGARGTTTKETITCRPTTCEVCGKTTWKGCGKHIDSVKEQVPPDQWCDKNHTDEEYALAEKKSGFFGSFCS